MKKIILSAALIIFILSAQAQQKKESSKQVKKIIIPELVKKSFATKYPNVKKAKWDFEKPGQYEAEFNLGKVETSVLIDEKGNILEVETEMHKKDLPQPILNTLATDFIGYKFDEVEKVEAKGITTYEMEAKKGKEEFELVFDINGKLLKKEVEKD